MIFSFATDQFDRLTCSLELDNIHAVATASDRVAALDDLITAIASVEANGMGECFWLEAAGEYRWVFRREGENVRVAVLWSAGVMTGWEHVFWAECSIAATLGTRNAQALSNLS